MSSWITFPPVSTVALKKYVEDLAEGGNAILDVGKIVKTGQFVAVKSENSL